jgi:MFS family permease
MFTGIGMMAGPLAGGLLYEAGGYITPFVVLGSLLLVFGVGCLFINTKKLVTYKALTDFGDAKTSVWGVFKHYEIWPCALSNMLSLTCLTFKEPILAEQLAQFSTSETKISLIFCMDTISYTLTSLCL